MQEKREKEKKVCNFGEHFTIDGYRADFNKLNSKALVLGALKELPEQIGMKILGKPVIYKACPNDKKDPGGWSGFVMVVESHISIHTFPARGFVSIDVYSCKNGLDTQHIRSYFKKKFSIEDMETNFLKRGTRYPVKDEDTLE
ncbi:MAG: S-adenosylmethionine decarboxylase [Patescibacteria group bacterium]|nr:S-adenosylmethionine decarboxylase [Patescibacteria group bacterium]